jgi:release factor glutamine methyltransferase
VKTIGDALKFAQQKVDRIDAQLLIAHVLNTSRASVIANADRKLDPELALMIGRQIAARERGVPVAQIIGNREFYGRDFQINEHVLIPRPETEILIEQVLAVFSKQKWLETTANRSLSEEHNPPHIKLPCPGEGRGPISSNPLMQKNLDPGLRRDDGVSISSRLSILDLGTGSGAIAITLALELAQADISAVDLSPLALALAQRNADALGAQVNFIESDWFSALADKCFDLIVSNPPYVARDDKHLHEGDLRFEPRMALTDESDDGLDAIRLIVTNAASYLQQGGWLMFEHGYNQDVAARQLMEQAGFIDVTTANDLAGIPRVTSGRRPAL